MPFSPEASTSLRSEAIKAEIRGVQAELNELLDQPGGENRTERYRILNKRITDLQKQLY